MCARPLGSCAWAKWCGSVFVEMTCPSWCRISGQKEWYTKPPNLCWIMTEHHPSNLNCKEDTSETQESKESDGIHHAGTTTSFFPSKPKKDKWETKGVQGNHNDGTISLVLDNTKRKIPFGVKGATKGVKESVENPD